MTFLPFVRPTAVFAAVLVGWGAQARAANFSVTNLNNSGAGSLRQAVLNANAAPSDDTISFDGGLFAGARTITLTSGYLAVTNNGKLSISGPSVGSVSIRNANAEDFYGVFSVNANANLAVSGLSFSGSKGVYSGAISNGGILTVNNCAFAGNNAMYSGGAISNGGTLMVNNCAFAGNVARGGGAINNNGTMTVNNSTFRGNSASDYGGAMTFFGGRPAVVNNCTFIGNSAPQGGALFSFSVLTVNSCTLVGNYASSQGGAFFSSVTPNVPSRLDVSNSLLAGNVSRNSPNFYTAPDSSDHNLIVATVAEAGLQTDSNGKAVLANNGGPTQTIALLPSSPAIDAGATDLTTDQRGLPRPLGQSDDIGAFEFDPRQSGSGFVVNTTADHNDDGCGITDCTLREAINAANSNGNPDETDNITFAPGLGGIITLAGSELSISQSVNIAGPTTGTGLTVSGNKASRVFNVAGGTVSMSDVVIANGKAAATPVGYGGCVYVSRAGTMLTLSRCVVTGGSAEFGAGICTLTATVNLLNCTLARNTAEGSNPAGGALNVNGLGAANIVSSTITDNTSWIGGGIYQYGTLNIRNSIIAGNIATGDDDIYRFAGAFSSGYNLIGVDMGNLGPFEPTDKRGTVLNPLDPGFELETGSGNRPFLKNNGGPTPTIALISTSPAINAGETDFSTDQRGVPRPSGTADDMGAFEYVSSAPSVVSVTPQNASDAVGNSRNFALTVRDEGGVSDITEMWLLINTRLDWAEGATLVYFPQKGELYLRQGDSFGSPIKVGAAAGASDILDNGALRIVGSQVSVETSGDGNGLTLSIPATVRNGLVGNNTLYGRVQDASGQVDPAAVNATGFVGFGPYTVTPQFQSGANRIPTLSALSPKAASTVIPTTGVKLQSFVFYAKDEDGIGDLDSLWFMAGKQRDGANSATFVFIPRTRRLYLRSDDGSTLLGGGVIGTQGSIENSQVKVDLSQVQFLIYGDGKSVGLRMNLQPKAGLIGQNNIWLRVQDNSGATSTGGDNLGFVQSGTWNVTKQSGTTSAAAPSAPGS